MIYLIQLYIITAECLAATVMVKTRRCRHINGLSVDNYAQYGEEVRMPEAGAAGRPVIWTPEVHSNRRARAHPGPFKTAIYGR